MLKLSKKLSTMSKIFLVVTFHVVLCQSAEFEDAFKSCHPDVKGFDNCIREALNAVRPYFKTGLPKYNVAPFDPFYAKETTVKRGVPNLGFTLRLRNVTETGWTASKVTKFTSYLTSNMVVYTQSFPEKFLAGDYEFEGNVLGRKMNNRGKFTLALYDLTQTTTITRPPRSKLQVRVEVEKIRDLSLHMTNLLSGRQILETMLDRVINGAWQPGFVVTKPLINDLVSSAFTEIFDNAFRNFPFEKIIVPKSRMTTSRLSRNSTTLFNVTSPRTQKNSTNFTFAS